MDGTIIQQGKFTSTGANKILAIRSDVDWILVYNYTALAQAAADKGCKFYFQRGMTNGTGVVESKLGSVANDPMTINELAAGNGFTLLDTTLNPLSAATAITGGTNATQPVYSTANTGSLTTGSVVRLSSLTGQENLAGIDFQVDTVVANTSFRVAYAIATAPGAAATAGNWRQVKYDAIYYPRRRFIGNISAASPAVVTCTVDHGLTVGQEVRMVVPAAYGMTQMDGILATITAVTANTLTLDVDSSAFTAFQFPLPGVVPFSPALVVPVGENTAEALTQNVNILADATTNTAIIGVELAGGASKPAGENNDVIYWVAGKSFSVDN